MARKNLKELENPGVTAAIKKFGTVNALADACDVAQATVVHWNYRGIPAVRAVQLERLTGVPRENMRPDIFGPETYNK